MTLIEIAQEVTGSGTLRITEFSVDGTHEFPDVDLEFGFTFTELSDPVYTGKLTADGSAIIGTWTEPGISIPLDLKKSTGSKR